MITKALYFRLFLLWALIATVRLALTWGLTTGGLSPGAVSILTLAFLPVLLAIEGLILLKAAREFPSKPPAPRKTWDSVERSLSKFSRRSMRIFLGLLLFALPYGLWSARFDAEATLPVLVGCVMNLLFVSFVGNALAFDKKRGEGEKTADARTNTRA
ncbi:MAG: hypothetical protein WCF30_04090 [Terracidiphilus sp.]